MALGKCLISRVIHSSTGYIYIACEKTSNLNATRPFLLLFQMEIPLFWNDSRLTLDLAEFKRQSHLHHTAWTAVDPSWKDRVWFPKLVIENMQEFTTVESITTNEVMQVTTMEDK